MTATPDSYCNLKALHTFLHLRVTKDETYNIIATEC